MGYIDTHKDEFGVEPICRVLQFAPSTYYAAKSRPRSPRAVSDALLGEHIKRVHEDNYAVYGVRKVWRQLRREGETAGRDQVGRVMGDLACRRFSKLPRGDHRNSQLIDPVSCVI